MIFYSYVSLPKVKLEKQHLFQEKRFLGNALNQQILEGCQVLRKHGKLKKNWKTTRFYLIEKYGNVRIVGQYMIVITNCKTSELPLKEYTRGEPQ